jgi:hypothetical protein
MPQATKILALGRRVKKSPHGTEMKYRIAELRIIRGNLGEDLNRVFWYGFTTKIHPAWGVWAFRLRACRIATSLSLPSLCAVEP